MHEKHVQQYNTKTYVKYILDILWLNRNIDDFFAKRQYMYII